MVWKCKVFIMLSTFPHLNFTGNDSGHIYSAQSYKPPVCKEQNGALLMAGHQHSWVQKSPILKWSGKTQRKLFVGFSDRVTADRCLSFSDTITLSLPAPTGQEFIFNSVGSLPQGHGQYCGYSQEVKKNSVLTQFDYQIYGSNTSVYRCWGNGEENTGLFRLYSETRPGTGLQPFVGNIALYRPVFNPIAFMISTRSIQRCQVLKVGLNAKSKKINDPFKTFTKETQRKTYITVEVDKGRPFQMSGP